MAGGGNGLATVVAPAVPEDADFARRSDAYLGRALSLACYILGDANEAEDATQDAMSRAWQARRSLRRLDSFDAWLDRILVNACRDRIRRRRQVAEIAMTGANEPEAFDAFGALMARDAVGRALQSLTVDQRTVVVLRYWRDFTLEQIAERLGWPLGTVKSRLHYGLVTLREQLERNDREVQR
jgi:RNA polymerase sigma-70 factor (ECF subfamily)